MNQFVAIRDLIKTSRGGVCATPNDIHGTQVPKGLLRGSGRGGENCVLHYLHPCHILHALCFIEKYGPQMTSEGYCERKRMKRFWRLMKRFR